MSSTTHQQFATNGSHDAIDAAPVRVFLWMVPRTCSTVLLKCMSFVDDCAVWMEPYHMCHMNSAHLNLEYLKDDPDMVIYRERMKRVEESAEIQQFLQEVIQKASTLPNIKEQGNFTYPWLQEQLSSDEPNKRVIFIKDQSFSIAGKQEFLPKVPFRHTFIIRHPREMFVSFRKLVVETMNYNLIKEENCDPARDAPTLPVRDFYKSHFDNYKYVTEHLEPNPIIIDAHDLLSNPKKMLSRYFQMLDIPFKESYLSFRGDQSHVEGTFRGSFMGVLASAEQNTLKVAFNSSKFSPPKYPRGVVADDVHTSPEVEKLIREAMPYYEKMYSKRLVIED